MQIPADPRIAVIGLGYVGLPLTLAFAQRAPCTGFDIDQRRISELAAGHDRTGEVGTEGLQASSAIFSSDEGCLDACNTFIVSVPTPIDQNNVPDLHALASASRTVGRHLSRGDVVIFESTVYPGATEEICVPALEETSGLRFNVDFSCGYSPERINPGDRERRLASIIKITSGSNPEAADYVDALYRLIISAGTHRVSCMKSAEAAKVIENVQRDVNIALVNELAQIFRHLDIDTEEVLKAAGTKWNFIPMRPGLVGGHCIGVDPYYLANRAQKAGYFPELIVASRRINDAMGKVVSSQLMRLMTQKRIHIVDARILVMGLAFKENCPDLRNTRVVDIVRDLQACNARVDVFDPWVDSDEAAAELGFALTGNPQHHHYDAVVVAVGHQQFREMGIAGVRRLAKEKSVIFDVKYVFGRDEVDGRL
jgi:UDP-N-acetyl-D-glucosamine/UDP-N-acetyl-D-galactosamine dehydrogenase